MDARATCVFRASPGGLLAALTLTLPAARSAHSYGLAFALTSLRSSGLRCPGVPPNTDGVAPVCVRSKSLGVYWRRREVRVTQPHATPVGIRCRFSLASVRAQLRCCTARRERGGQKGEGAQNPIFVCECAEPVLMSSQT